MAPNEPLIEILSNAFSRCDPVEYDRLHFICSFTVRVTRCVMVLVEVPLHAALRFTFGCHDVFRTGHCY